MWVDRACVRGRLRLRSSRLPSLPREGLAGLLVAPPGAPTEEFAAALSGLVPLPQRNTVNDALQLPAPPRRVLDGQSSFPGAAPRRRVAGAGRLRPGPARAGAGGRGAAGDRAGGLTASGPPLRLRGAALPPGGPSMAKKAAAVAVGGATLPLRGPSMAKKAASMALGPAALHQNGADVRSEKATLRLGGARVAKKAAALPVRGPALPPFRRSQWRKKRHRCG